MLNLGERFAAKLAARPQMPVPPEPGLLLSLGIPRPMHGLAPRVVMGKEWWDQTRNEAYQRTNFHCLACEVHKTEAKFHRWLEAHEIYDIHFSKGRMKYLETVPLCHACHCYVHLGRTWNLMQQGQVTEEKFLEIYNHGQQILIKAGLPHPSYQEVSDALTNLEMYGKAAPWEKWRLCIGKKKYKPLYESYEDWVNSVQAFKNAPLEIDE